MGAGFLGMKGSGEQLRHSFSTVSLWPLITLPFTVSGRENMDSTWSPELAQAQDLSMEPGRFKETGFLSLWTFEEGRGSEPACLMAGFGSRG